MDTTVHAAMAAVRIREEIRLYPGVIECSIENSAAVCIVRLNVYPGQVIIPSPTGCLAHAVEVPVRKVRLHVSPGTLHVDGRDTHLDQHLLATGSRKLQQSLAHRLTGTTLGRDDRIGQQGAGERLRETGVERNVLVGQPIGRAFVSAYLGVAHHLNHHVAVELMLNAIIQVQDEARVLGFGESVAMNGRTCRGGQLGLHPVTVQEDGVIARLGHLALVGEGGTPGQLLTFGRNRTDILRPHGGHQQHVAIVRTTRTTKVGMGKAIDGAVRIIITGAGIPLVYTRIGAGLNHAVGNHRAGIGMSMTARTDEGINVGSIILWGGHTGSGQQQAQQTAGQEGMERFVLWHHNRYISV